MCLFKIKNYELNTDNSLRKIHKNFHILVLLLHPCFTLPRTILDLTTPKIFNFAH